MIRQPSSDPDLYRPDGALVPDALAAPMLKLLGTIAFHDAREVGKVASPAMIRLLHALDAAAQRHKTGATPTPGVEHVDEPPAAEALTVREMAERMGCSTQWVRHLLNTGRLTGRKSGRVWIVHVDPLLALTQVA